MLGTIEEAEMKDWTPVEAGHWTPGPGTQQGTKHVETRVELNRVVSPEWHLELKNAWGTTTAADYVSGVGDTIVLQVDVGLIKQARAHLNSAIEKANTAHVERMEKDAAFLKKAVEKSEATKAYREDLERKLNED